MKIAFVLDDTLDTTDGVQQYVILLGSWLVKRGHTVHYLTGESHRSDIPNLYSMSKNVRVSFNKNKMSIPVLSSTRNIKRILNNEHYDILHFQMPFSPMLAGRILAYCPASTACIATFHIAPHSRYVTLANRMLGRFQAKSLQRIHSFLSVSSTAKKFAQEAYKVESLIVPNAIDIKAWSPDSNKQIRENTIVFVGRLVKRKGALYLLQAFRYLLHGNVDARLVIVGDGPERKHLEAYVKLNNLQSVVSFTGYVTEQQKIKLLQEANLAVYPSTGGESFGIVLLEAMAAGAVVLAGNNPGYKSVLAKCPDSLFDPKNEKVLADILGRALTNREFYSQIRTCQQRLLQEFDISITGNAILKVYKQAIMQAKDTHGKPR